MADFTRPDMLKPKAIKIPTFQNSAEAVAFVLKIMDEDKDNLEKIVKCIVEGSYKDLAYRAYFLNILCQKLSLDYKEIHNETEEYMDKNWDKIKGDAQDRIDIEKRINDIFSNNK